MLAQLGLNAYRFSLEWSRIEPEPGFYSRAALDHYGRMIES
jgi:beta-glucosidase